MARKRSVSTKPLAAAPENPPSPVLVPEAPPPEAPPPEPREPPPPAPAEPEIIATPTRPPAARFQDDLRRGLSGAVVACAALAAVEYAFALATAQGSIGVLSHFRFLFLDVTLASLLLVVAVPLTTAVFTVQRRLRRRGRPARTLGSAAPWLWALTVSGAAYAGASFGLTLTFHARFKDKFLIAASLAFVQLGLIALLGLLSAWLAGGLRRLAARLHRLGRFNPFGRVPAALAALALLAMPALSRLFAFYPQFRDVVPWRLLLSAAVLVAAARRGDLLGRLSRRARLAAGAVVVVLIPPSLLLWGVHPEAKYLATTASPALSLLVSGLRAAHDFDGDGYGNLLGENDCGPFDATVHPGAVEIPDNGVDENCNGRDFTTGSRPVYRPGERMAVPAAMQRDWNFLLITVDALRYDHTGFGGYRLARGRDTTPRLDELAARGVSFDFAHSASPGTMASVPALLASRFFHSGMLLGPERRPMPPKVLPENTLLAELLKKRGYRTGAVVTHEYFNDWGLEQGFDLFDNELGAEYDPGGITSPQVTSRAQAWIARQGNARWFLWAHYLDPHGHYVEHPGETRFGKSEEDLYDGEIAYTDKHIGRLLDSLAHSPAGARTIVIVTADHGDAFMEHGFVNHAVALYRELINVPLVIYVPDGEPRTVAGPVSNLDLFPTIADLAGIDLAGLPVEGESLVPQLFYGRDARDRVVFAETNFPDPIRGAIADRYKIIQNLKSNVIELYDLKLDPLERRNLWGRDPAGARMKAILDEWLDRGADQKPRTQQPRPRTPAYLLASPPAPMNPVRAIVAGTLEVVGWDATRAVAGQELELTVYFTAVGKIPTNYRVEAELGTPSLSVRQERVPAGDGAFPTSQWPMGQHVKEVFRLKVAPSAAGSAMLTLRVLDALGRPAQVDGAGAQLVLGQIPIATPPPK